MSMSMNYPQITLIVARARNGVIGYQGKLPWHLPPDLRRFKALTMGTAMIMGRKTFESLPKLLPGRQHIVLTRDQTWAGEGAEVVHSVEQALASRSAPRVSVIGGEEIYALFLPYAHSIELTAVHIDAVGDTMLASFAPAWREVNRTEHPATDECPAYAFVTLVRA